MADGTPGIDFDPDKLRERYRAERDKRLRDDANEQYVEIKGEYAGYVEDPYVNEKIDRAPLSDEIDIVVVGGGFGGLLAGARLREAGLKNIRMIEKGGDFGGTWYWNRYPGAACDIESYIYLPLLEETGFMPKEKYTPAKEILEHSARIARHYDLYDDVLFQTEVTAMNWEEDAKRWIVETNRGDSMKARYVIMSNGPLHRPKLPGIPGIESFKGHTFHTSRWDYDYTGGGPEGGLDKLKDKRIGIIGTGATAVQCVPHLGAGAKELFVFQRTPSSIDVRDNKPTDSEWAKSLEPGWQKKRMDNFNILVSGGYQPEDLVQDGWTDIIRNLLFIASKQDGKQLTAAELEEIGELADFKKMESIRARVDEVIADSRTADALKPWYRQFCKRPCFHDDYLATFNRESVHLIDTDGKGVERITEKGVVVAGKEYEIDCLIYATGFEVGTSYTRRSGYELYGRGGKSLSEAWEGGVESLHGMFVRDFPNVFVMGGAQAAFTANYPHQLDEQGVHLGYILSRAFDEGIVQIEPEAEAQSKWVQTIISKAQMREKFLAECTPGYYNNEGQIAARARQNSFYGGGSMEYFSILKDWRETGEMAGLEVQRETATA
ncbi:NAD(P)/FAD-dependent oxidoreductase [Henriciella barbarensis]|uniref:NAD(P)/FAD-dependent oxidoreductase n=1 Tax=Henriciella barbarensis TaxID=86342 RepID=A0A399R0H1_9PROT|nr:NAD(P)/FAD-dependent oxidoreductase [Henriciella barbarensis]RIJ24291.1 NAD(P)/FAD-dependent oxidoreductase [Henriciella barbarensis]